MLEFPVLHQEKQITVISALDSLGKERQAEEEDTLISKTHIHISSQLCHTTERKPELKSSRGLHTSSFPSSYHPLKTFHRHQQLSPLLP